MRRARRKLSQNGPLDRDRAFEILFRQKTFASVWHWLDRLGVPLRDRRDVAQEVFLAAHQSFHTYDPMRSRPERWLNKITVHIAAHYRDRAQHRREELTPEEFFDVVDENPGPDEQIRQEEDRLEVLDLLQTLDVDLRSVLIAHDIDGIPMAEIAEQHGIPLSTAYKWRARALAAFQAAIEQRRREEDERTGGAGALPGVSMAAAAEMLANARRLLLEAEPARLSVQQGVVEALDRMQPASLWARVQAAIPRLGGRALVQAAPAGAAALAGVVLLSGALGSRLDVAPGPALVAAILPIPAALAAPAPQAAAPALAKPPAGPAQAAQPATRGPAGPAVKRSPAPAPAVAPEPLAAAAPQAVDHDLALFDACQRALARGEIAKARRFLDAHMREVPQSRFSLERRVIHVRLLILEGDREGARRAAESLVASSPSATRWAEIKDLVEQRP